MTTVNNHDLDPAVEVVHLRRLLDVQPGCLMRLGADGTVLAANDAALMLLGERSRAEALGRDIALWIPPDQHERWRAFSRGVVEGSPSSIECDIAVPSGARYPTLFHAIPLAGHPDGVASMAVSARVISAQRQLEAAAGELREQLQQSGAELQARDQALAAAEAARRGAEADCARAQADVQQLEMALNQFAKRQTHASAERSATEWDRLTASLQEREGSIRALENEVAESKRREQEVSAERDRLQRQLEQAVVAATDERNRIASALRDHAMHLDALAKGIPGEERA